MKWLFCLSASPTKEDKKADITSISKNSKFSQSPNLEKSDSAYVERASLGDLIESTGYGNRVSAAYSTEESADGQAAALKKYGPPKPTCNAARLANIEELGCMEKASGDPQIQHIMQLMCTVFKTQSALVAFVGDDSIYIADSINFKKGDFPWRMSFCAHSLTPANHQVLVIEDAAEDSRFKHLPIVKENLVRFYAGTPIVSSRGHRLGTVCFASDKPRKFDAEGCMMLTNMGELVTRELEREWAAQQAAKSLDSSQSAVPEMMRALECFKDAVMFVDVSQPRWKILHMNTAAQTRLSLHNVAFSIEDGSESCLWDLFNTSLTGEMSVKPWEQHADDISKGRKFEITGITAHHRSSNSTPQPVFSLTCRCAANDQMDSNAPLVGAPAYMPMTNSNHQYYFVTLSSDTNSRPGSTASSIRSQITGNVEPEDVPFDNLELGPLLGKGGYGKVFRGVRDGTELAVKVISNTANLKMLNGEPLEVAITRNAKHRNLVNTLDYAVTHSGNDTDSECGEESFDSVMSRAKRGAKNGLGSETWMVLEFCDCGCLQEASDKGFFRPNGKPDFSYILTAAADIAAGMAYLHSRGIAHGDLTGGNVLLASDSSSFSGVVAKVADFGLARAMDVKSKIETRTYGTVTHMPPELLEKGIFSKAADSFALGVLLWEMYSGVRAWSSMNHAQIITAVAVNKRSLKFPSEAPAAYVQLANSLMSHLPVERPSFEEALQSIKIMQETMI